MAKPTKRRKKIQHQKISNVCYFTQTGTRPDYKDVLVLRKFLTDRFKVLPQKLTGLTAKNQRLLSEAIKRARYMALLPYTDQHSML